MKLINPSRAGRQAGVAPFRDWPLYILVGLISCIATLAGLHQADAWTGATTIPGSSGNAFYSDVAVSSSGKVHFIWHDLSVGGKVVYGSGQLNDAGTGITWEPFQRFNNISAKDNTGRVAVDGNGTVHVTFIGTDAKGYYYYNKSAGASGSWVAENFPLNEDHDLWSPDLTVDASGYVYVAWAQGIDGSQIWFANRGTSNVWSSPINVSGGSTYLTRNTQIGVIGTGSSARVHVAYESAPKSGSKFKTCYSQGSAAGFAATCISDQVEGGGFSGTNCDLPMLGVDRSTGYINLGFTYGSLDAGYNKYFVFSPDGGVTWTTGRAVSGGSGKWYGMGEIYANSGVAHMISEQKYWDGKNVTTIKVHYQSYTASSTAFSEATEIGGFDKTTMPRISGGGSGKVGTFTKGNTDNVYYNVDPGGGGGQSTTTTATSTGPTATATTAPSDGTPDGSIKINNGKLVRKENIDDDNVTVLLTLQSGTADQYKIWNATDNEPTSYTDMDSMTAPDSWIVSSSWDLAPTSTDEERYPCATLWVYMRLKNTEANKTSARISGSVDVDPGVDALVTVANPGPGDTSYTGGPYYVFTVEDQGGECNGIRKVEMWETGAVSQTITLSNIDLSATDSPGVMPLISATPGDHTIRVRLTDGVDNVQTYDRVITVDTEAPSLTASDGALTPVDNETGEEITTETDTSEIGLHFDNVTVTDNMYGTKTGEARPFWGICAVNSLEDTTMTVSELMEVCTDREVTSADEHDGAYTFTVNKWNLVEDMDPLPDGGATIYVKACIMDGANCADQILSTEVVLADDYTVPQPQETVTPTPDGLQVYLPLVLRR